MLLGLSQAGCCRSTDIVHVNPAWASVTNVMPNNALLDIAFSTVVQQVLHEEFRPEMGEGEAAPFDIPLNKLMPAKMSDPGIVVATRAEVHDVLHADFLRDIQKSLLCRIMSMV